MNVSIFPVYLVVFTADTHKYITTDTVKLAGLIRQHNRYGIEYISRFDPAKERFVKMSRKLVKQVFGFDTDATQELIKVGYIK